MNCNCRSTIKLNLRIKRGIKLNLMIKRRIKLNLRIKWRIKLNLRIKINPEIKHIKDLRSDNDFLKNSTRIHSKFTYETRRNWSRPWHAERCSKVLITSLPSLTKTLINQFALTHWINTPKTPLARLILWAWHFNEVTI